MAARYWTGPTHCATVGRIDASAESFASLKRATYWTARRVLGANRLPTITPWYSPSRSTNVRSVGRTVRRLTRVHPPVVEDLKAWAQSEGVDVVQLSPAELRVRRLPTPLESEPHPNYAEHQRAKIAERFLVCIAKARLWGENGLVVLPDGSFAAQAIYERPHLEADRAFSTPLPFKTVQKRGDYVSLLGEFSNAGNYYHWLHDGLLRLHGVGEHVPRDVRYVLPASLRPYQREMLAMAGVPPQQIVLFRGDEVWECERLWFPSLPPAAREVPDAVSWLRDRLRAAAGVEQSSAEALLYLSRDRDGHGRVVNEDALIEVLRPRGFQIVRPAELPIVEQIKLFAGARVVVSPTSAGQANLLYAPPTCRSLELLEPEWAAKKAFVVWGFAETLGQPFYYLVADTARNPDVPTRADLRVPVPAFERAIDRVLADDADREPA